jgi:hypothetical protein
MAVFSTHPEWTSGRPAFTQRLNGVHFRRLLEERLHRALLDQRPELQNQRGSQTYQFTTHLQRGGGQGPPHLLLSFRRPLPSILDEARHVANRVEAEVQLVPMRLKTVDRRIEHGDKFVGA